VAGARVTLRRGLPAANEQSDDTFCHYLECEVASCGKNSFTLPAMNNPMQPNVKLTNDSSYRENYANSVQMRVNIWDFFLIFGTLQQQTETQVEIRNFQGIYLSPQQAKALLGLLQQNVTSYEGAFGEIKLDPRMAPPGPVH
jgi:flagellar protein FlaG